ncbi:MAG TPA: DNA cytosine methyltransferase [Candidatus Faecousia intestinavium]|nr:DNA cytosine methyltransferase [Candidatus Faecousia intestinavium]
MKQQTFIAESEPVLCLNDQGGQVMDCTENITGTLRAQMHSHQPLILESNQEHARVRVDGVSPTLPASMGMGGGYVPMVYENHGIDSRYTGPHEVSPTISARCGTGGNNIPLVEQDASIYCIVGNIIDRQPENGGNGCGYQEGISYTLTAMDRHAIYSRQRVDVFAENEVACTESARQHKDATDLVMQPYQETVGTLVRSDHKGISNQYVTDDKCIVEGVNLIRRLTPLECERLQGFPDGWTNIPGASDSARYKALGNSVAIPCVEYVMRGIAMVLQNERSNQV